MVGIYLAVVYMNKEEGEGVTSIYLVARGGPTSPSESKIMDIFTDFMRKQGLSKVQNSSYKKTEPRFVFSMTKNPYV